MKLSLALFIPGLILLQGCRTNNAHQATPTTGYYRNIPNWYDGDTLKGFIIDSMGNGIGTQSLYTKTAGDTSMIIYLGRQYYIFQYAPTVATDSNIARYTLGPICISTRPDTSGSVIDLRYLTAAAPHKYLDENGQWQHQRQALIVGDKTFFPTLLYNTYISDNVKY